MYTPDNPMSLTTKSAGELELNDVDSNTSLHYRYPEVPSRPDVSLIPLGVHVLV